MFAEVPYTLNAQQLVGNRVLDGGAVPAAVPPIQMYHGTTTLAFQFDGGVIVAVDSRASLGKLVGSRTTDKVLPVTSSIIGTMAGGAADCLYWIRALSARMRMWEITEEVPASAEAAAHVLGAMLRQKRGLSVGTMIVGHDRHADPCIFYLDDSGVCVRGEVFSVGSGSPYAISVLDAELRHDLSIEEATDLAMRAIQRATHRDAFSGGYINVFHVTKKGVWQQLKRIDSRRLPSPHQE
jgi:20S proteasome subunit beta 5